MPSDGEVINCRGNAAYGPLIYIHPADHFYKVEAAHRSKIELELLPSPHAVGNHVMAAAFEAGLRVIDIGDPTTPTARGIFPLEAYAHARLTAIDHYVVILLGSAISIFDVDDPDAPAYATHLFLPGQPQDLALLDDRLLLVASGDAGLVLVDHGSRVENSNAMLLEMADMVRGVVPWASGPTTGLGPHFTVPPPRRPARKRACRGWMLCGGSPCSA